jgi:uncharacterized protein YkwD
MLVATFVAATLAIATPAAALNGGWSRDPSRCSPQRFGMPTLAAKLCGFSATTTTRPLPPLTAIAAADLFVRLNAERAARHLAPLRWDGKLALSATAWSSRIGHDGYLHHSDMNTLFGGRFDQVGENVAYAGGSGATTGVIHDAWMHSSGHRENMLAAAFDVVGIGVYCGPDGTMWATQQFGRFSATGPPLAIPSVLQNPIVRPDSGSIAC